jgi:hypothetical protein
MGASDGDGKGLEMWWCGWEGRRCVDEGGGDVSDVGGVR